MRNRYLFLIISFYSELVCATTYIDYGNVIYKQYSVYFILIYILIIRYTVKSFLARYKMRKSIFLPFQISISILFVLLLNMFDSPFHSYYFFNFTNFINYLYDIRYLVPIYSLIQGLFFYIASKISSNGDSNEIGN